MSLRILSGICLCSLLDGVAADCLDGVSCSASRAVFDCDASYTDGSGVKHCCCTTSSRFCSLLSDCDLRPARTICTSNGWTGDKEKFSDHFRYKYTFDNWNVKPYKYIDMQVRSGDHRVSAYLARGAYCDMSATDSGFRYLTGYKVLSDNDLSAFQLDTGPWSDNIYCLQLDCNNWVYECEVEVSLTFRSCWDPSPPPPLPSPPPVSSSSSSPSSSSASSSACEAVKAACAEGCSDSGQTVLTNTCYISGGITVKKCTCKSVSSSSSYDEESESESSVDDPCFARDTFAISASGKPVPMASLKSGDLVMDGPSSVARIIVNQHRRKATFNSTLLKLEHANGELSLTPDHVLEVDGQFVPARLASAGTKLGKSVVSRATTTMGEVINPLTTSGKILTQDGVLATTYPEWIAEYMLSSHLVPLPLSLSNLISFLFPETTQAYYDTLIEPLVTSAHPKHLKAGLPATLVPAAFLLGDLTIFAGFVTFCLASRVVLIPAFILGLVLKAHKI